MNNQSHRLQMINAASNRKCVRDEANRFNSTMKEPEESTWTDAQHFKNKEGNTSRRTPKNKSCYLCAVKVQKAEQCQRGCSSNFLLWRQKMPKTTFNCSTSLLFSSLLFSSLLLPPLLFSTSRDVSISRLPNRKAHASAKLNTEFDWLQFICTFNTMVTNPISSSNQHRPTQVQHHPSTTLSALMNSQDNRIEFNRIE